MWKQNQIQKSRGYDSGLFSHNPIGTLYSDYCWYECYQRSLYQHYLSGSVCIPAFNQDRHKGRSIIGDWMQVFNMAVYPASHIHYRLYGCNKSGWFIQLL